MRMRLKRTKITDFLKTAARWRAIAAFFLPFSIYLLTAAPTIYNLDSAELTTAVATGGLLRATGYPLYLLLGQLWVLLPIGDVGFRMNLLSAFMGALTILLVERILYRLQVSHWAVFMGLGLLATAPFFWSLSLIAEVYTLHTALMALLILLLLSWSQTPSLKGLFLTTLTVGLSMGHHLATVLLVPGAVWYVLVTHPREALTPRLILAALFGLVLGLSVYVVLPLRYLGSPEFNYAGTFDAAGQFHPVNLATPAGFWWLVTGKSFAAQMFAYRGAELWGEVLRFASHLTRAFFGVGIGLGIIGIFSLARKDWRVMGMFFLMFFSSAIFYIDYQVIDKETMFLPTYVVWAVWVAVGADWLFDWVGKGLADENKKSLAVLQGAMAVTVFAAVVYTAPKVDLSHDWSTRQLGEKILQNAEPNALIFGWWDMVPVIQYLQLVENQRPDVQVINRFLISYEDLTALAIQEAKKRPVYIDDVPPNWATFFESQTVGEVIRIWPVDSHGKAFVIPNETR